MFYAMNRFPVAEGRENEFEEVWKNRESRLKEMPGFISFKMLRGQAKEGKVIFISQTLWQSGEAFQGWVNSDQFKQAHGKSKVPPGVIMGPPQFESYDVVIDESN